MTGIPRQDVSKTVGETAQDGLDRLVRRAHAGEINRGHSYGVGIYRLFDFDLTVGDPDVCVSFVTDLEGEVLSGEYVYTKAGVKTTLRIPLPDAMALWEALNTEAPRDQDGLRRRSPGPS